MTPPRLRANTRVVGNINFSSSNQDTNDSLGHGTHVAGIIAGNGSASSGTQLSPHLYGIAPSANLVNVRVLDNQGSGTVSNVIAGINWVVQNKAKYNIRVLNVSLGHPVYESYTTDPFNKAVQAAWKAGIVVVCSAGNNGRTGDNNTAYPGDNEGFGTQYGTIQCPGNDPMVITVGAMKNMDGTKKGDKVATYSSRGPSRLDMVIKPDIMAPGNHVVATCADGSTLDNAYGGNTTTSGCRPTDTGQRTLLPRRISGFRARVWPPRSFLVQPPYCFNNLPLVAGHRQSAPDAVCR